MAHGSKQNNKAHQKILRETVIWDTVPLQVCGLKWAVSMERRKKQISVERHWIQNSLKVFCFFLWVFLLYETESENQSDSDSCRISMGALGLECNVS